MGGLGAYECWIEGGCKAAVGTAAFGGQGLPLVVNAACTEIGSASKGAFGQCPLLTGPAIEAQGLSAEWCRLAIESD